MNFNLRNSSNAVQVCMSAPLYYTALGTLGCKQLRGERVEAEGGLYYCGYKGF
jgi:hypothetical protein